MSSNPVIVKLKFIAGKISIEIPQADLQAFQSAMNQWMQNISSGTQSLVASGNPKVDNLVNHIIQDIQHETNGEVKTVGSYPEHKRVGYGWYTPYYWNSWWPYWYNRWWPYYWWPYGGVYAVNGPYSGITAIGGKNQSRMASALSQFRG